MVVAEPAWAGDDQDEDEKTYDRGAKVKIELRQENGKVVKHRGEMRSFGTDWRFEFEGEGHHHVVVLNANNEEGSKTFDVTLAYERDAIDVIAPYSTEFTARKREALWTDDGKIAIALTFYPKKFEREDKSRDDDEQIKPDDSDDPLGGNLFK